MGALKDLQKLQFLFIDQNKLENLDEYPCSDFLDTVNFSYNRL